MNGMTNLIPPGVKPIKQCELYKKHRPYVNAEYQDIICPEPDKKTLKEYDDYKKGKDALADRLVAEGKAKPTKAQIKRIEAARCKAEREKKRKEPPVDRVVV